MSILPAQNKQGSRILSLTKRYSTSMRMVTTVLKYCQSHIVELENGTTRKKNLACMEQTQAQAQRGERRVMIISDPGSKLLDTSA